MALLQSTGAVARGEETTIIGETLAIRGQIAGDESLTILGRVEGGIQLSDTLEIAHTGVVKADVAVEHAVISGLLVGNVTASGSVHVTETGRLVGDISAPRVVIVAGARVRGQVDMAHEAEQRGATKHAELGAHTSQGRLRLPARQQADDQQRSIERLRSERSAQASSRRSRDNADDSHPQKDFGRPHLQERAHSVLTDLHPRYARAGSPLAVPLRSSHQQAVASSHHKTSDTRDGGHHSSGSVGPSEDAHAEEKSDSRPLQHVHVQSKKRHNRRRDG